METQNGRSRVCNVRSHWKCHKKFDVWIEKLGITNNVGVMQKNCIVWNCEDVEESVGDVKKK